MTYQKYINNGTACFIPGKVVDECYKILRNISSSGSETRNLRAHEILQELRDISSMAIEHFDEKIVPDIKKTRPDPVSISSIYEMLTSPRPTSSFDSSLAFNISQNSSSSSISQSHKDEPQVKKTKLSCVVKLYNKQSKIIKAQSKQIAKMMKQMTSMKRQLFENEIKSREMVESIKQLKTSKAQQMTAAVEETSSRTGKKRSAPSAAAIVIKRRLDE
jgi:F-box protein 28